MSNYSSLGISCVPQTAALTSNAKYILPNSPEYHWTYTPMMQYPASDRTCGYNGLVTRPIAIQKDGKGCSGCKKWN